MNDQENDILQHGITSQYWEEYTHSMPWKKESTQTKLYVAGILNGFSHDFVLRIMEEQEAVNQGGFRDMGFFVWTEYFEKLKSRISAGEASFVVELEQLNKLNKDGALTEREFYLAKRKILGE